jgi:hypothetical protein
MRSAAERAVVSRKYVEWRSMEVRCKHVVHDAQLANVAGELCAVGPETGCR